MIGQDDIAAGAFARHHAERNSLVDWLHVLLARKRLLLSLTLLSAAAGLALALLLPAIYRSETRILPPQQNTGAAALLEQLGGVPSLASGALGIGSSNDLYLGILRSRSVSDRLIARFDLRRVYDAATAEAARVHLAGNTTLRAGKDNIISIAVDDSSAQRAQSLANAYVEELFKVTSTLALTDAARRRLFYESALRAAKDRLAQAETTLHATLDAQGMSSVDSQGAALLASAALVRSRISLKEVELGAMESFVTARSQQYLRAREELSSLRAQLSRLEGGRPPRPAAPTPPEGLASIKSLRELKHYQMLYELLANQYEGARLAELRDPAAIQVIDSAVVAETKSKPQRALIVLLATFTGLCAAMGWICLSELMRRSGNAGRRAAHEYAAA